MTDQEQKGNNSKKMSIGSKIKIISLIIFISPFLMLRPIYWLLNHYNLYMTYMDFINYVFNIIYIFSGTVFIFAVIIGLFKNAYHFMKHKSWKNTSKRIYLLFSISFLLFFVPPITSLLISKYAIGGCINYSYGYLVYATIILAVATAIIVSVFTEIGRMYINILVISGIISILVTMAWPDFYRSAASANHCMAPYNLKLIYKAEKEYHSRNGEYSASFEKLNWVHKDRDRFCYQLSDSAIFKPASEYEKYDCTLPPGIKPFVSKDRFLIIAVGNIDNDATLDVWSINEKKELKNLVDDVEN